MLTKEQLKNYWAKVDVKGEDECWDWTAYKTPKGYGRFGLGIPGKKGMAHRVSAYIVGLIQTIEWTSNEALVLHKCDNPSCVNHKHFFIGSVADNMDDRNKKGRQANGVENGMAKLTEEEVLEIRQCYAQGGIYQRELAKIYGVSKNSISHIVHRKCWAHI